MNSLHWMIQLGAVPSLTPEGALGKSRWMALQDSLLIIGVGLVLMVFLLLWAVRYARTRPRRRRRHSPHASTRSSPPEPVRQAEEDQEVGESAEGLERSPRRHRRRRRRRASHRPSNPTLAETGGLPPVRPGAPDPPPA